MPLKETLKQAAGVSAIVVAGVFQNCVIILGKVLATSGWPFFRLMGTAAICIASMIFAGLVVSEGPGAITCKRNEVKWVLGRGICGTGQFLLAVLAALAGAGVGDIGALSSVNTVVAAILGRVFLGERLGPWCVLSVLLAVAGAFFISDPGKLDMDGNLHSILGYILALLSGTSYGLMFICSRKSGSASSMLLTISAMGQRGLVCWTIAFTPLVHDGSIERARGRRWECLGLLAGLTFMTFMGNFWATVGAKRCPAAVSATTHTAVSMSIGYGAQVAIFKRNPTVPTLVGAGMMLLAVLTMAIARLPPRSERKAAGEAPSQAVPPPQGAGAEDGQLRSLASFVASEYAERKPPEPELSKGQQASASELRPRPTRVGSATLENAA